MPTRSQWSHILDNNERRKAQNRAAQRKYRTRQRRRLEAAETILDMTTQMSAAIGQGLLGLLNTSNFDNLSSGDFVFPEMIPQGHLALDVTTPSCQCTASSRHEEFRYLEDCQAESISAGAALEFGNDDQMYGTTQPLSPNDFENPAGATVTTKSPEVTPASLTSHNTVSCQGTVVDNPEDFDYEEDGCNPLLAATLRGNTKMVKLLAEKGAELEKVDIHGRSALMISVERDDSALALTLLRLGADIRVVDRSGLDLFQKAAAHVNITMLRTLLEWCREASEQSPEQSILKHCVNRRDNKGRTLIHAAALQGKCEVVELLLEYGADVNASSR